MSAGPPIDICNASRSNVRVRPAARLTCDRTLALTMARRLRLSLHRFQGQVFPRPERKVIRIGRYHEEQSGFKPTKSGTLPSTTNCRMTPSVTIMQATPMPAFLPPQSPMNPAAKEPYPEMQMSVYPYMPTPHENDSSPKTSPTWTIDVSRDVVPDSITYEPLGC